MDPATEFTRVFGDGDTSDAALEAKLQELCTYLLAFEERGEVFGRRCWCWRARMRGTVPKVREAMATTAAATAVAIRALLALVHLREAP